MNLRSSVPLVFVIPVALAVGAPQLFAQGAGPHRGLSGLFGGGRVEPKLHQKLEITLSSTRTYDDDASEENRTVGAGAPDRAGRTTIFGGALDYAWQGRRVQVRASGSSSLRYFRPLDDTLFVFSRNASHTAGAAFSARLPGQTTLLVNQTLRYSPSYLYNLFPRPPAAGPEDAPLAAPDDAPSDAPDYANSAVRSRTSGTVMTLTHDINRRSRVSAIADYQYSDTFRGTAGLNKLSVFGIRGQVSHRLTPNTTATAEYFSRTGDFGDGGAATTHEPLTERGAEVGADYRLPLSQTRRVALGARFGVSTRMLAESAAEVGAGGRHYDRLSGQVAMGYDFGQTWQTRAIYQRGVEYVAGLTVPVSTDSVTATVDGLLTRRIDVLASASYSSGASALNPDASLFETYTGGVRLRYALARVFAAHVEYLYYLYDSLGSAPLAPGIPARLERNGVRVGLTLSVPVVRR